MSLVVSLSFTKEKVFPVVTPMKCITLNVYSDLEGVALTAAVAGALADNNIPCNLIAAYHHDHIYVPSKLSERALSIFLDLPKNCLKLQGYKSDGLKI